MSNSLDHITFGRSGTTVTKIGLGGEGVLRTYDRGPEARNVIEQAIKLGVGYFDSARVYSDSEVYLGSVWKENGARRQQVFQTSKSASRDREGALADLDATLQRLATDYLDLWQIHDLRTEDDFAAISRKGGALEAFVQAKKEGRVRLIGVTGHHDPYILSKAVREWPVDSVLLPVNPVEEILGGFMSETMPAAKKRGIAVIGMKIVGAGHYILPKFEIDAQLLIRYALSQDITVAIVGCGNPAEVEALVKAGSMPPVSTAEKDHLLEVFRPYAQRLAFYRGVH